MANEKQEHRKKLDEFHSYVTEHMKPSGIKFRRQNTTMCIGRVGPIVSVLSSAYSEVD